VIPASHSRNPFVASNTHPIEIESIAIQLVRKPVKGLRIRITPTASCFTQRIE